MRDKYLSQREQMVNKQLVNRGINDPRVLEAFRKIPREKFVPESEREQAYGDHPLPIGHGQTISQPYIVALMTEALEPSSEDVVLEIGTGSGYQTALLAELTSKVYSLERIEELAKKARHTLEKLGYENVFIEVSDGKLKLSETEVHEFDKIIVTAAASEIPSELTEQLKEGGKMIIPVGNLTFQELLEIRKKNGKLTKKSLGGCRFVPLK